MDCAGGVRGGRGHGSTTATGARTPTGTCHKSTKRKFILSNNSYTMRFLETTAAVWCVVGRFSSVWPGARQVRRSMDGRVGRTGE